MSERRYLLTRCLRLEAQIVALQCEVRDLRAVRPNRRTLSLVDRQELCALREQGRSARAIAKQTGWSIGTVYNVTNAPCTKVQL